MIMHIIERENIRPTEERNEPPVPVLAEYRIIEQVTKVIEARQVQLEEIKHVVSLKFFHDASEKLNRERDNVNEFILGNESKQERARLYSHILSETYFEQLFF